MARCAPQGAISASIDAGPIKAIITNAHAQTYSRITSDISADYRVKNECTGLSKSALIMVFCPLVLPSPGGTLVSDIGVVLSR